MFRISGTCVGIFEITVVSVSSENLRFKRATSPIKPTPSGSSSTITSETC